MPVSAQSTRVHLSPTDNKAKAFKWARELLPLFKRMALKIESNADYITVLLQCIDTPDPVLVTCSPTGLTCTCILSRNHLCEHIALVSLALGRSTKGNEADLIAARVCCSLIDFDVDRTAVRARVESLLKHSWSNMCNRQSEVLEVHKRENLWISLLRNRVVAFMCTKCGDIWEGNRKSACECVIDFVCKMYVTSANK
jgi:hypothetical protein